MVRSRRLGLSLSLVVLAAVTGAPPARAAQSVEAGWWTSTPVPVAPDAPADGLVVQAGADANQPFSYAAVAYDLAPGEVPLTLTLVVAEGSVSTTGATLALCPLTAGFAPSQGGPIAAAPSYDCAARATAAPAADGATYQFDVSALSGGGLAVAVLPGAAGDRVVLAKPTPEGLQSYTTASPSTSDDWPDVPAFDEPATVPSESGVPVAPITEVGSDVAAAPAPALVPEVAVPTSAEDSGEPRFSPTRSVSEDEGSLALAALLAVMLVVAAALWSYAGAARDAGPTAAA